MPVSGDHLVCYGGWGKPEFLTNLLFNLRTDLRKIAKATKCTNAIESGWLGAIITLKIVGNVRRPDGTIGNAIRIDKIEAPKS